MIDSIKQISNYKSFSSKNSITFFAVLILTILFAINGIVQAKVTMPKYTGKVFPTPQKVSSQWEFFNLAKGKADIKISSTSGGAINLARKLLVSRIAQTVDGIKSSVNTKPVTIILGKFNQSLVQSAIKKYHLKLGKLSRTLPPQGYIIRVIKGGNGPVVLAAGVDGRGAFYAAATLIQMIGKENGKPVLKIANIDDWPNWQQRYLAAYAPPSPDLLKELALYKINGISIKNRDDWRKIVPDKKPTYGRKTWRQYLTPIKKFNEGTGLFDIALHVNLYAVRGTRKKPIFDVASKEDVNGLIARLSSMAKLGIDRIMVQADDWTPAKDGGYILPNKDERKQFGDIAGKAHGYLMRRLYEAIKPKFPNLQLAFCPAPYSIAHVTSRGMNAAKQKQYLRDMAKQMPQDVQVVWTGPRIRSYQVARKDYLTYKSYILDQPLYMFVNPSWTKGEKYMRWMPRFGMRFYKGFAADSGGVIYINGDLGKPWNKVFELSANDYLWNLAKFSMSPSYRNVILMLYGKGRYLKVNRFTNLWSQFYKYKNSKDGKASRIVIEMEHALKAMKEAGLPTRRLKRQVQILKKKVSAAPPTVKISRFTSPPKIDGKLDDPAWRTAAKLSKFKSYHKGRSVDTTTGLIGYDNSALYLAFIAYHSKPLEKPQGVNARRDAPIFNLSDAIEIFLRSDVKAGPVCHLVFDHEGNQFDENSVAGRKWNPSWKIALYKKSGVWQAEVRIPFASLEPPFKAAPHKGTVWAANFCRSNASAGQLSSWSPTFGSSFHDTLFFGKIIFQ